MVVPTHLAQTERLFQTLGERCQLEEMVVVGTHDGRMGVLFPALRDGALSPKGREEEEYEVEMLDRLSNVSFSPPIHPFFTHIYLVLRHP